MYSAQTYSAIEDVLHAMCTGDSTRRRSNLWWPWYHEDGHGQARRARTYLALLFVLHPHAHFQPAAIQYHRTVPFDAVLGGGE